MFRLRLHQPRTSPFCFRFCDFCSRGSRAVSLKRTFLSVFKIVQLLSGFWFHTKVFFVQFTARFGFRWITRVLSGPWFNLKCSFSTSLRLMIALSSWRMSLKLWRRNRVLTPLQPPFHLHWRKMSAHESRKMARDTFPGLSLALMKKALPRRTEKGCRLRIGSLLVSVLFRAIKASFNASFKWNVFLENVYVL